MDIKPLVIYDRSANLFPSTFSGLSDAFIAILVMGEQLLRAGKCVNYRISCVVLPGVTSLESYTFNADGIYDNTYSETIFSNHEPAPPPYGLHHEQIHRV